MYRVFLSLIFMMFTTPCYSQKENGSMILKIDGYMIDFSGQMIFQPCDSDTTDLFESLDGTSFNIWCNQITDRLCESFDGLGDTIWVDYSTSKDANINYGYIRYFHCMIKIALNFIGENPNDFRIYDVPKYEIIGEDKRYPLLGFYVRGFLKEVIPTDRQLLLKMYKFYDENNYTVPPLIDSIVNQKILR